MYLILPAADLPHLAIAMSRAASTGKAYDLTIAPESGKSGFYRVTGNDTFQAAEDLLHLTGNPVDMVSGVGAFW